MPGLTLGSVLPSMERYQCKYEPGESLWKAFCTKNRPWGRHRNPELSFLWSGCLNNLPFLRLGPCPST